MSQPLPSQLVEALKRQKYQLVGGHSAVKKCRWLHQSLVYDRPCYKQKFYGIKSHRCVQMTPTVAFCTMRCRFCWRIQPDDIGVQWDEMGMLSWDDPATVVDGCIQAQRRILTGYKAQVKEGKVKAEKYEEALNPRHAAISLAGEPTLYPYLNGLVYEFHKRGFTTFIVTNGTAPEILCKLENEPSQLYVSLCAPDEKTFLDVCRPQMANAWKKINETLASLASFSCPTVIRLTLLKNLTLKNPERYAALITKALPTYVEPKGAMFVGYARRRINFEDMPTHEDIRSFSLKLAEEVGYNVIDESVESRVLLLSRLEKPIRLVNQ